VKNYIHNLIYHIYAEKTNPILTFNIENLKKYIHKFNGKKVININYEEENSADFIIDSIKKNNSNVEFFLTKNKETGGLYELYPFVTKLLPSIASNNENEFTFYAHAKGVTRYNSEKEFISLLWANLMYTKNLDDFGYINNILEKYPCAGCLKINKPYTALSFVNWHYSGAFFWFRNKDLFSREWKKCYNSIYGLEGYLATHFSSKEAFSIDPELPDNHEDIYKKENWEYFYKI